MRCVQVSAERNIGHFLFENHGCDDGKQLQFAKVPCQILVIQIISFDFSLHPIDLSFAEAMADIFSAPEIAKHIPAGLGPVLKTVPVTKRSSVFLHPWHLDLSEKAKFGETGKYPSMCQVKAHLPSVIWRGYQQEREALEIKFNMAPSSEIGYFQVKYIDGHCKGIMCQAILGLVVHMLQQATGWNSNIFKLIAFRCQILLFQHVSTWAQTNQLRAMVDKLRASSRRRKSQMMRSSAKWSRRSNICGSISLRTQPMKHSTRRCVLFLVPCAWKTQQTRWDKYPNLHANHCKPLTPDPEGTAHRTSEKQKPGPLDLALLFKEVIRVKKGDGVSISVRECLFSSVAEYNKKYGTTKAGFLWAIGFGQLMIVTCFIDFTYNIVSYYKIFIYFLYSNYIYIYHTHIYI